MRETCLHRAIRVLKELASELAASEEFQAAVSSAKAARAAMTRLYGTPPTAGIPPPRRVVTPKVELERITFAADGRRVFSSVEKLKRRIFDNKTALKKFEQLLESEMQRSSTETKGGATKSS